MVETATLRQRLEARRDRLEHVISSLGDAPDLERLLGEVDAALGRLEVGTHGTCELCQERVEDDTLRHNPVARYCLCDLSEAQQAALEHDLELASRVQWAALPEPDVRHAGWEAHYRYLPAGPVSGDFCELVIRPEDDSLYFLLGDVSGKGVAAAFLMARLNALFRTLIDQGLGVRELVERANALVAGSTIASQYATLVCGRATADGEVELTNAGHVPPLARLSGVVKTIDASGFPVGLFASGPYESHRLQLEPGDALLLCTDGLTEASDAREREFGSQRVASVLAEAGDAGAARLAARCLDALRDFVAEGSQSDDLTILAVRRTAER